MKTTEILSVAFSALSVVSAAAVSAEKRQSWTPISRSEAKCCYDFGVRAFSCPQSTP